MTPINLPSTSNTVNLNLNLNKNGFSSRCLRCAPNAPHDRKLIQNRDGDLLSATAVRELVGHESTHDAEQPLHHLSSIPMGDLTNDDVYTAKLLRRCLCTIHRPCATMGTISVCHARSGWTLLLRTAPEQRLALRHPGDTNAYGTSFPR